MAVVMTRRPEDGGQSKRTERSVPSPVPVTLGWRGVSLRVPEEWTLTKVSGDGPNGYLRADNLDGFFVQVKWTHKKGLVSVPDAFDTYVRDLQKTAKKQR